MVGLTDLIDQVNILTKKQPHTWYPMTCEDFLNVICRNPNEAAKFIFVWADSDFEVASKFLLSFYTKVFNELDGRNSYLRPICETTSFGNRRPSVSGWAFDKFCELLNENQKLIMRLKELSNHPTYPISPRIDCQAFDREEFQQQKSRKERINLAIWEEEKKNCC